MIKATAFCILAVLSFTLITKATELPLQDGDSIKISFLPDSEGPVVVSDKDKAILRYGFHRTQDCKVFEKAFVCIRKCLDLKYHIAQSDKNCVCTCYKNNILAQYRPISAGVTKWKLGATTTSLPPWAEGGLAMSKPNDYEINANFTEFVGDTDIKDLPSNDESGAGNNTDSTAKEPTSGVTAAEGSTEIVDKEAEDAKAGDQPPAPGVGVTPEEGEAAAAAPAEVSADAPAEVSADAPAEVSADAPAEVSTDAPAEVSTDAPAEVSADAPAEVSADAPAEVSADAPAEEPEALTADK